MSELPSRFSLFAYDPRVKPEGMVAVTTWLRRIAG